MFRVLPNEVGRGFGFPRVSGDVPVQDHTPEPWRWFSPRERGCSDPYLFFQRRTRVFPA